MKVCWTEALNWQEIFLNKFLTENCDIWNLNHSTDSYTLEYILWKFHIFTIPKMLNVLVELPSEIDRFFHGLVRKMKIKSYIHF